MIITRKIYLMNIDMIQLIVRVYLSYFTLNDNVFKDIDQ